MDINHDLETLISNYAPDIVGIEKLYFGTNITTAIDVAQCRGVLVHTVVKHGIQLREFTPLQVKKGICGNGRAVKKQVQNTLKMLFKLEDIPKPDDAADALAIAYLASLGV
jgi:crossover junction endodeoxyribonuclease RuvC